MLAPLSWCIVGLSLLAPCPSGPLVFRPCHYYMPQADYPARLAIFRENNADGTRAWVMSGPLMAV